MFDLGIEFVLPMREYDCDADYREVTLVRFVCGCEWRMRETYVHGSGRKQGRVWAGPHVGERAIAHPQCPLRHMHNDETADWDLRLAWTVDAWRDLICADIRRGTERKQLLEDYEHLWNTAQPSIAQLAADARRQRITDTHDSWPGDYCRICHRDNDLATRLREILPAEEVPETDWCTVYDHELIKGSIRISVAAPLIQRALTIGSTSSVGWIVVAGAPPDAILRDVRVSGRGPDQEVLMVEVLFEVPGEGHVTRSAVYSALIKEQS